jgi:predicted RNase H-like HicB family nuclease
MNTTPKFDIDYTVQIWQEGSQFVAHAMPLDVMSAGRTPEEARQAVAEAVQLFLTTAIEIGTLEEVLEDTGYLSDSGGAPLDGFYGMSFAL